MYILNHRSKILHWNEENGFYDLPMNNIDKDTAITIENETFDYNKICEEYILPEDKTYIKEYNVRGLGLVKIEYNKDTRGYSLCNNSGLYFCAEPNNVYSFSRETPSLWETFIFLNENLIEKIEYFKNNKWISKRTGELLSGRDFLIEENFSLKFNGIKGDLRLQDFNDFSDYKTTLINGSWKPEEFLLYNPLIYITAYSSEHVFNQFRICVESIRKFGEYSGKIVVMTDADIDHIQNLCQEYNTNTLDVDIMYPKDLVGYVCSKYLVFGKDTYKKHQPILYLDPDIVFDAKLEPLLVEATLSEKICAPLETFHRLDSHPPIGSGLIQMDGMTVSPYAAGYNGGTISIPNVENTVVQESFKLICRTIMNVGFKFGRNYNIWADQEVLNYIASKFNIMDPTVITKYAKYHRNTPAKHSIKGFVHFFGHSSKEKVTMMEEYVTSLNKYYDYDLKHH